MKNNFLSVFLCLVLLLALTPSARVPAQETPREVGIGLTTAANQHEPHTRLQVRIHAHRVDRTR